MSKTIDAVEKAFQSTTEVLLGRKLANMKDYEKWLASDVIYIKKGKSALSGEEMYYSYLKEYNKDSKNAFIYTIGQASGHGTDRLVSLKDATEIVSKRTAPSEEIKNLNLANAAGVLKDISYITHEIHEEPSIGIEECPNYAYSNYCYHGQYYYYSKYCAYCLFPRHSEYAFGSWCVFDSKFCIRCHESSKLTRCFEVAESTNCRDSYFCYNCENLDNCMFCFNTKSKRYAIGYVEVGKEKYMEIKKMVLNDIASRLEKDKGLKWDIYNIGCAGKKK